MQSKRSYGVDLLVIVKYREGIRIIKTVRDVVDGLDQCAVLV